MKVFISWSGQLSGKLAHSLREWLPKVIQSLQPYYTPFDVDKGARWLPDITNELNDTTVGLLCMTQDNVSGDWILFEAGALSKTLDAACVCPILFGIRPTDMSGPLKQFQATRFEKPDFRKMMTTINSRLGEQQLPEKTLETAFDKWWPDLETEINEILFEQPETDEPLRSDRDLLEELLEITRRQTAFITRTTTALPPSMTEKLLEAQIELHNQQANKIGGYQDTLDVLKKMHQPIDMVVKKYRRLPNRTIQSLYDNFKELSYEMDVEDERENDEDMF